MDGGRREQRRRRDFYRAPYRQDQRKQHIFSRNRQDIKGQMPHTANHCQGKRMVEHCDFLADGPDRCAAKKKVDLCGS